MLNIPAVLYGKGSLENVQQIIFLLYGVNYDGTMGYI